MPDLEVVRYLVELLVDFTHIDTLYKIHSAQGRRVEDVKLSGNFELCAFGLGHVRAEPERLRNRTLRRIWATLLR